MADEHTIDNRLLQLDSSAIASPNLLGTPAAIQRTVPCVHLTENQARHALLTLPLHIRQHFWLLVWTKMNLTVFEPFIGIFNPANQYDLRLLCYFEFPDFYWGPKANVDWYTSTCSPVHYFLLDNLGKVTGILRCAVDLIGPGNAEFARILLDNIARNPSLEGETDMPTNGQEEDQYRGENYDRDAPAADSVVRMPFFDNNSNTGDAAQKSGEKRIRSQPGSDEYAGEQVHQSRRLNRNDIGRGVNDVEISIKAEDDGDQNFQNLTDRVCDRYDLKHQEIMDWLSNVPSEVYELTVPDVCPSITPFQNIAENAQPKLQSYHRATTTNNCLIFAATRNATQDKADSHALAKSPNVDTIDEKLNEFEQRRRSPGPSPRPDIYSRISLMAQHNQIGISSPEHMENEFFRTAGAMMCPFVAEDVFLYTRNDPPPDAGLG